VVLFLWYTRALSMLVLLMEGYFIIDGRCFEVSSNM
jgi:Ni,Fe-hydrogenase I cytochrome b subunit